MLEQIFGERGALAVQFVITSIVVLGLIVLVVWLIRRFAMNGIGGLGLGRARMPRLAIVDAMPIDSRRRLVLVRRDNIEHLILVGGTNDIVVEPTITRARAAAGQQRPAQQAATTPSQAQPAQQPLRTTPARPATPLVAAVPEPPAPVPAPPPPAQAWKPETPETPAAPIPFPRTATAQRPTSRSSEPVLRRMTPQGARPAPERPAAPPPADDLGPIPDDIPPLADIRAVMAAAESEGSPATGSGEPPKAPAAPRAEPEDAAAHTEPPAPPARTHEESGKAGAVPPATIGAGAGAATADAAPEPAVSEAGKSLETGEASDAGDEPPSPRINELEREMARLLGEMSNRRSS